MLTPSSQMEMTNGSIAAIVAGFLLQTIFLRWFGVGRSFVDLFALSVDGITSGKVWTLLTYSFLHSPSNLLHVIANLLGLYFLGRELLPVMGSKRFLWFYGAAAASGGLLWLAANWTTGGVVWGASAAVYGLLTIFACFYPNRQVTFLLFFVVPVTVKPKYVAYVLLGLDRSRSLTIRFRKRNRPSNPPIKAAVFCVIPK